MCGIAGYYGVSSLDATKIDACLDLMRRRGPDDSGVYSTTTSNNKHICLLHSRLSILDIDARSSQPFRGSKGILAFNGEIYNYLEIKATLQERGKDFKTTGDTEVLNSFLEEGGLERMEECEGMWAFAYFDTSSEKLTLSRDRFGQKPLYIYREGEDIYFGSEPKFLFALLGRRLPINVRQIKRYLVNGYKSLYKYGETFYEGMVELKQGSLECYRQGFESATEIWPHKPVTYNNEITYEQAVKKTRESLINSVELCLRADVPIAFCLSGGVDSNALIAIAKKVLGYDVHGFTIMNKDVRYEEREMVETSVQELGLEHTAIDIETEDFLGELKTLISYHDAPIYTITYFAHWKLMASIREAGYKVSVSGTGADELFSGYFDHHNAYLKEMHEMGGPMYEDALKNWERAVQPIVRNPYLSDPNYLIRQPSSRSHIYLEAEEFSSAIIGGFDEGFIEKQYSVGLLRNRMSNELYHESVPVILHEDDLNAMYYSIENRSPFLSSSIYEVCKELPTHLLIRNGLAKAILRDAVSDVAPQKIIQNPRKVGFNVPVMNYLDHDRLHYNRILLEDSPIFSIVDREYVKELLSREHLENSKSKFLFNFICAKFFMENAV